MYNRGGGNSYILYGAGELGKETLLKLKRNNVGVIAVLDKQASEKENWGGIPVLMPDTAKLSKQSKEESFVIICLNAGMVHYEVAEELYALGFEKLVFLPMRYGMPYAEKVKLTNLYNKVLSGEDVGSKVKKYCEYRKIEWNDNAVIRFDKDKTLVWVGQEILYSEDKERWKGDISKINTVNEGIDVNLNAYYWYHNLFDYLDGYREECDSYLSIFGIIPNSDKAISTIEDRENLFSLLKKELSNGLEYFFEAAPEVMWNKKGYFNIVGGNHRTIFLQHQGYVLYPVRMSEEDYKIWKNETALSAVIRYIEENKIKNTYVPVPHPNFINFPYLREEWGETILKGVLNYLGPIRLEGMKVIDASQYEGYFARVTKRMCAKAVEFYSNEKIILGLAERIFRLLHVENIGIIDDNNILKQECEGTDIIFGMLNTSMLLELSCLDHFSGKLFSEFWADDNAFVEVIMKKTKLKHYTVLQRKVFQGRMLEVGVFEV